MPLYEYVCSECGHEFELFVRSLSAQGPHSCPQCTSQKTSKRFSTFATSGAASGGAFSGTVPAPSCTGPV